MPDQAASPEKGERIQSIIEKYQDLKEKVEKTEPLKQLEEGLNHLNVGETTLEMYSEVLKSYTLILIKKFTAFLEANGENLSDEQLQFIEENILNSSSIYLAMDEDNDAEHPKPISRSTNLQRFILSIAIPLLSVANLNKSMDVPLEKTDWDQIIDMANIEIAKIDKAVINEAKNNFLEIMERRNISDKEAQVLYLQVLIEAFGDVRQIVGEIAGSYAKDAYNNITADCSLIFQRILFTLYF